MSYSGKTLASFLAVIGLAIIFSSCAGTGTLSRPTAEPVAAEAAPVSLSMPPGWDDAIIDRIQSGQGLKKRIAVLDFEGLEKLQGKADLKLADLLITSLVASGRFDVIERSKIVQVLAEQDLALTGIMDESTAAEVGQVVGAEWVILGTVTSATQQDIDKFGYILAVIEVAVDVRAVDATTGKIMLSQQASGRNENKVVVTSEGTRVSGAIDYAAAYAKAAQQAIDGIGLKMGNLFPLLGYVVNVDGNRVVTDIGEERGVAVGDQFVVFRVTTEIRHPVSGERIGWNKEVLATLKIRGTERSLSTGEVISKADESSFIIPGDLVISAVR